jgi:hypothetical protein
MEERGTRADPTDSFVKVQLLISHEDTSLNMTNNLNFSCFGRLREMRMTRNNTDIKYVYQRAYVGGHLMEKYDVFDSYRGTDLTILL